MSDKLEALRAAYAENSDAIDNYTNENCQIALRIADGFRDYLGLPNLYETPNGNESYLRWFSLNEDGETEQESMYTHAVRSFTDGTFDFGFAVALERSQDSFPKKFIVLRVYCQRSDGTLNVKISGRSVDIADYGDPNFDIEPVHLLIFDILIQHLEKRPGSGQKREVGFGII